MKIESSMVLLNSFHERTESDLEIKQVEVALLTSDEQAAAEQEADLVFSAKDGLIQFSPPDFELEASVTVDLHTTRQDRLKFQTQASIITQSGSHETQQSLQIAQSISETLVSESLVVRRSIRDETETGDTLVVQVGSISVQKEQEQHIIEASGIVTTSDGREISFMLELDYQRQTSTERVSQFIGERNLIDPLMINIQGEAVTLSDVMFEFDIDADGTTEGIYQPSSGTGFLAFDQNENGVIDDGSELFGPSSTSGFWELGQFDSNNDGWIDENDSQYSALSFMSVSEEGQQLQSLAEAGIGAIYLASTEFKIDQYTQDGLYQGQTQRSGLALSEQGTVLHVQDMHYSVQYNIAGEEQVNNSVNMFTSLDDFQFEDELLDGRNPETMVGIMHSDPFNTLGETRLPPRMLHNHGDVGLDPRTIVYDEAGFAFTVQKPIEASQQTSLFSTPAPAQASPPASDHKPSNAEIAARMMAKIDSKPVNREADEPIDFKAPTAGEFRYLDNLPNKYENKKNDQKVSELRMVIDELKRMYAQQKERTNKLSEYKEIAGFNE